MQYFFWESYGFDAGEHGVKSKAPFWGGFFLTSASSLLLLCIQKRREELPKNLVNRKDFVRISHTCHSCDITIYRVTQTRKHGYFVIGAGIKLTRFTLPSESLIWLLQVARNMLSYWYMDPMTEGLLLASKSIKQTIMMYTAHSN